MKQERSSQKHRSAESPSGERASTSKKVPRATGHGASKATDAATPPFVTSSALIVVSFPLPVLETTCSVRIHPVSGRAFPDTPEAKRLPSFKVLLGQRRPRQWARCKQYGGAHEHYGQDP